MTLEKNKKVQRVVTTDSIDPTKLVLFQPTLCCKIGNPRCMKKGKEGQTKVPIRMEAYSTLACPQVDSKDKSALAKCSGIWGKE